MDSTPKSTFEQILRSMIDGTPYEGEPRSVMEVLLLELKDAIEAGGGGGGGTTNYNALSNKPKVNGVVLSGDKSASDLELVGTGDSLTAEQMAALKALIH